MFPRTPAPPETLVVVLAAALAAPSIARDRVRAWLRAHRWSPSHINDLVLAVNEAVSNSVEHGYGMVTDPSGTCRVEVRGRVVPSPAGMRRAEFLVADRGRWVAERHRPERGRGLPLMRACTEEVSIDRRPDGTTVRLRSHPIPSPSPDGPADAEHPVRRDTG